MKLTKEQQMKFEGYIGLLNDKIGINVNANEILADFYKGLDDELSFQEAYEAAYANALKNQVISGIVDKVGNGEDVPLSAGEYLGAAMDYLFDTLADSETKEEDPYTVATNLDKESAELKEKATALTTEWKAKYEGRKFKANAKIARIEKDYKGKPEYNDLALGAQSELDDLLKEEASEKKKIDEMLAKSSDYKKEANKTRGNNPHHITKGDYDKMITNAFVLHNSKLESTPRYIYLADNVEAQEEKDGYSQYTISRDMIKANYDLLKADMRHGDLTADGLKSYIGAVSEAYMVANYKYNKLGFFKKWFSSEGRNLRNDMANIKDPLKEAQEYLIKHAASQKELDNIKSINIRDSLHTLGTRYSEVTGQHRLAINNIKDSFNESLEPGELKEENVMKYVIEKTNSNDIINTNQRNQVEIEELNEIEKLGPINNDNDQKVEVKENPEPEEVEEDLFADF